MKPTLLLIVLAVLAGAVLPLQAALNARLGKAVINPLYGAWLTFIVGAVGLLIYLLLARVSFATVQNAYTEHWSVWMGGLLGAFYVVSLIILVPKLGTALSFGLIVAGQMSFSLLFDHYGWWGVPVQPINWTKIMGVVLIIGGVLLIRSY
jgi:transporter family-2 protein